MRPELFLLILSADLEILKDFQGEIPALLTST